MTYINCGELSAAPDGVRCASTTRLREGIFEEEAGFEAPERQRV